MRMGHKLLGLGIGLLVIATAGIASRSIYTPNDPEEREQIAATPNASSGGCGVERWSVKTGTDVDVGLVNLNSSTASTIAALRALTAPSTLPASNRVQPTETTQFVVSATLQEYKLESDSDYHLVISDASGNTMIAEIPDPACVGSGSPFTAGIQTARAEFDNRYAATTSFQTANIPVCLKGVGFFDFQHGQTGVAPNAIELHPVLDVQFNPGSCSAGGGASPPTASNGSVSTSVDTPVNGSLSASGTAPLSYAIVANPAHGSVTLTNASSGAFTYTPASGYAGSDSFTFDAGNTGGTSNVATESVTVNSTAPNPPTASNGSVTTAAGTAVSGTLSASGTGPLSFAIVANPAHGTATLTNTATGAFTYTPASGFSGSDPFTFDASNGGGTSNVATESVTVSSGGGGNVLQNGVPATGLSAAKGQQLGFSMAVPAGAVGLSFHETGGTGTPDLYVRFGTPPTTTAYDCRQYASGGSATCSIAAAQAGTYYVMLNAYTAFSGWSLTGSYSTGGGGGGGSQLIGDPGFEGGSTNTAPWTISSGVVSNSASEPPHAGSWDAWLDGYGTTHTDTASQQVTVPSTITTATLSFWLHIDTAESGSTVYDTLTVALYNTGGTLLKTLGTYSNADAASGYALHSFDVSAYKGQTVVLKFTGTEDASNQTSFVLDDVNLNVQ